MEYAQNSPLMTWMPKDIFVLNITVYVMAVSMHLTMKNLVNLAMMRLLIRTPLQPHRQLLFRSKQLNI